MIKRSIDNTYIKPLTGIRFIAALFVFFFHYNPLVQKTDTNNVLYGIVNHLNIGVTVFFVLSGFLICLRYYEKPTTRASFLKEYFIKRFARIYPLYFLLTTALYFIIAENLFLKDWLIEYFFNITFIRGFSEKYYLTGISQAWSLTVEETFYLSAPLIFYFIRYKDLFFSQLIFIYAIGLVLVFLFQRFPFSLFFNDVNFLFVATFFGRCFEFFVGIGLALLYLKLQKSNSKNVTFRFFNYTYLGIILIILSLIMLEEVSRYFEVQHATMVWQGIFIANFFLPLSIFVFFYGLIMEKSAVQKILSTQTIILLGKSSYAFYLISAGFIAYTIEKKITSNIFGLLILLLLSSIVLYYFVERLLYSWIVNYFTGASIAKAPPSKATD
jgi:peptidoglycan/LPS O-acetylase OafA/YrhL